MESTTLPRCAGTEMDLDLLRRLHDGDRDAFGEMFLLTELPIAVWRE
jgi:hypothetical protein